MEKKRRIMPLACFVGTPACPVGVGVKEGTLPAVYRASWGFLVRLVSFVLSRQDFEQSRNISLTKIQNKPYYTKGD
jgi:hypothetical protein